MQKILALSAIIITMTMTANTFAQTYYYPVYNEAPPQKSNAKKDYAHTWWFNVGAGVEGIINNNSDANAHHNDGPAGEISFNFALTQHQLLTARTLSLDLDSSVISGDPAEQLDNMTEIGLLYGFMQKNKNLLASIAAGVSYVEVTAKTSDILPEDDSETTKSSTSTVGIPVEAQLFFTPFSFLGIGIIGTANFNDQVSVGGALLAIQLGSLR